MAEEKGKPAPKMLRKITIAEIGFKRARVLEIVSKAGKSVALFSVLGIVNGAKPGATTMGEFAKLVGDFEAVNLDTGEVFTSQQCILPNFVGDPIASAIMRPNAEAVQFALIVTAEPDADSVTGYVYGVQSAMPATESSPLAQLRASVQKLLPAPKKA